MNKIYEVQTPSGDWVYRGSKAECNAYLKQALIKGSKEGYLQIILIKHNK